MVLKQYWHKETGTGAHGHTATSDESGGWKLWHCILLESSLKAFSSSDGAYFWILFGDFFGVALSTATVRDLSFSWDWTHPQWCCKASWEHQSVTITLQAMAFVNWFLNSSVTASKNRVSSRDLSYLSKCFLRVITDDSQQLIHE